MSSDDEKLYPAYSGLDRVAMYAGVPLMAGVIVFCPSLLVGLLCAMLMGPFGILLALIGVPVLMWFRFVCETDDQALRVAGFEIACWWDRRCADWFGGTYTLVPMRYGRSQRDVRAQVRRAMQPCWLGDEECSI